MPRPKPPPTPTGSTDLTASEVKGSHAPDMESMFALPPPAIRSEANSQGRGSKSTHSRETSGVALTQGTPPISPQDKPLTGSPRHKRTASGVAKASTEAKGSSGDPSNSYALPPPPSRARKIIQMKPKATPTSHSSPASDTDYVPPGTSFATSAGAPSSSSKTPAAATVPAPAPTTTSNSKRKQPSATSAAGRKIARKTAHSIIERRRRSKMNEEFGVLKDMIPACEGVEMHKLAILQAGIEYVRYLEGCVSQLKAETANLGGKVRLSTGSRMQVRNMQDEEEDFEDEDMQDEDEDQEEFVDDVLESAPPPAKIRNGRRSMTGPNEWSLRDSRKSSVASFSGSSAYPSPYIQSQLDEANNNARRRPVLPVGMQSFTASPGMVPSQTPTPTLLSPAFNSIHFSPDLSRAQTNTSSTSINKPASGSLSTGTGTSSSWTSVNHHPSSATQPSPSMAPLPSPKAALGLPLPHPVVTSLQLPPHYNTAIQRERDAGNNSPSAVSDASGNAEATASAALMMLTNEWRGGGRPDTATLLAVGGPGRGNSKERGGGGKGMSVRDLLSS